MCVLDYHWAQTTTAWYKMPYEDYFYFLARREDFFEEWAFFPSFQKWSKFQQVKKEERRFYAQRKTQTKAQGSEIMWLIQKDSEWCLESKELGEGEREMNPER